MESNLFLHFTFPWLGAPSQIDKYVPPSRSDEVCLNVDMYYLTYPYLNFMKSAVFISVPNII